MSQLFKADPGHIFDFGSKSPAQIFNEAILPRVNEFDALLPQEPLNLSSGLDEAAERRNKQLQVDLAREAYAEKQDEDFFASLNRTPQAPGQDYSEYAIPDTGEYDSPLPPVFNAPEETVRNPSSAGFSPTVAKLANYGYASDLTPDYNSNVKKIGHANNRLVDGYSAALTKSLAKKHGLKTGDEFEVLTADGKVLVRRYDDTVPNAYKGKRLPETVDLYETKGSNSFGGKVIGIRRISDKNTSPKS